MSTCKHITITPQVQQPQPPLAPADPQALQYRSTLCENFAKGKCRYGPRCMFAHGEDHLRTKEMNEADGLVTMNAIKMYQRRGRVIAEMRKAEQQAAARKAQRLRQLVHRMSVLRSGAVYCHEPYAPVLCDECAAHTTDLEGRLPDSYHSRCPLPPVAADARDARDERAFVLQRVVVHERVRGECTESYIVA